MNIYKITKSEEETIEAGKKLGLSLKSGDIVCLRGELGTGKTCFAKGIARGLGISGYVISPSFVLIREYYGKYPMYHIDLYRLKKEDLDNLGLEEYFSKEGVVVIEWAEKAKDLLTKNYIDVKLSFMNGKRKITIKYKRL